MKKTADRTRDLRFYYFAAAMVFEKPRNDGDTVLLYYCSAPFFNSAITASVSFNVVR